MAFGKSKAKDELTGEFCKNCAHFDFDAVSSEKYGGCKLLPQKQSRVDVDFTCEEFEKA